MKENYLGKGLLLILLAGSLFSCSKDDKSSSEDKNNSYNDPVAANLTADQQKTKLEAVARNFESQVNVNDFQNIKDLEDYIDKTYTRNNYGCDAVQNWADDFDAMSIASSLPGVVDTSKSNYSSWDESSTYTYTYYLLKKNINKLYKLSNLTGHFTATGGKWVYAKANDLQFIFNDKNGNRCVAKLVAEGKTVDVYAGTSTEWGGYSWNDDGNGNYTSYDTLIYNHETYAVPEKITVTLEQNGKTIVSDVVTTDISSLSSNSIDLSKSGLSATSDLKANGYEFILNKAAYTAGTSAQVDNFVIKKDNSTLLTLQAVLNGSASGLLNGDNKGDCSYQYGKADFSIDVMGQVQIKGTCSDCQKLKNYLDEASKNDENEAKYKSYISLANDLCSIDVYYDGNSSKSASVKLLAMSQKGDEYYNYKEEYWRCEPALYFSDGTTYSTFSVFFNENDFRKVINIYNEQADSYHKMVSGD